MAENKILSKILDDTLMRFLIKKLPLVSLLFSNLILLYIFWSFFNLGEYWVIQQTIFFHKGVTLFMALFFLSIIILKTNQILRFHKPKKQDGKTRSARDYLKIGFLNSIFISIRTFFFNILNDLFLSTIIWTTAIGVLSFHNLVIFKPLFGASDLISTISIIGIFSGFFQFYLTRQKEDVSLKVAKVISQYILDAIKSINFKDFMKYLQSIESKNKHYGDLFNRINKIILDSEKQKSVSQTRNIQITHQFFLSFKIEPSYLFDYLDYYSEFAKDGSKNKDLLKEVYAKYFNEKLSKFKKELDQEDFNEIKKILFSSIMLFEELGADLEKATFDYLSGSQKEEDPEDFRDFFNNFTNECIHSTLDKVLTNK